MEDYLKILKVEYLNNHRSDYAQISNLDTAKSNLKMLKMKTTPNGRLPQNIKYLSNHLSDLPQIENLSQEDQIKIENAWNEDDFQWKTASKY